MIVRERTTDFVMIEQDNHARISGEIISMWKDEYFFGEKYRSSVEYAVYKHDIGWKAFDNRPFWNDLKQAPYTFIDFPIPSKLVLYKHGIDEVEQNDAYAALLCSEHYTRFLLRDASLAAQTFVQQERERQHRITTKNSNFEPNLFDFHYKLLQLCDNLSLYMCLNEANVSKENEHPFFKNGIPFAPVFNLFDKDTINLQWRVKNTITMDVFPFAKPLELTLVQKTVSKENILGKGLVEAYQDEPYEEVNIYLIADT